MMAFALPPWYCPLKFDQFRTGHEFAAYRHVVLIATPGIVGPWKPTTGSRIVGFVVNRAAPLAM